MKERAKQDPDSPLQDSAAGRRARTIYGRRKGKRLRARRTALLEDALPRLALDLSPPRIDVARLFDAPKRKLVIEIGFGGGEHLAHLAAREPEVGFLGCEPFVNGVAKLLARIEESRLRNIRIHVGDGLDLLRALPAASVDRVYLLYPDPWPKRRHRRRRFVSADSLEHIARVLGEGGEFRFASDVDDYLAWTLARATRCASLVWRAEGCQDWLEPWPDWPGTRYEAKAIAEGRRAAYLTFTRVSRAP